MIVLSRRPVSRVFPNLTCRYSWLLLVLMIPLGAHAVQLNKGDYRNRPDVESFIESLAESSDYSVQELVELFSMVRNQRHLFARMDKPAEKLPWHQYRKIFLTSKRIKQGIAFWRKNRELLQQVEKKYQVPAEIIVAIVGVETFYGRHKGSSPVFDTLVTFAFDYPKRASFFNAELKQFLLLARAQDFNIRDIRGSYAGAMGMPQFIASSYRSYAVDFDRDGEANLFDSLPDVLGSVANYFRRHGWKPGQAVTFPLDSQDLEQLEKLRSGMKPEYAWQDLKSAGIRSRLPLEDGEPVALIRLQQKKQPEYWAGLTNFYVITRYNHSELYAMAVYQLSQKVKQGVKLASNH